jgi:hypothetical protein
MRKAIGIALGLAGLLALSIPAALLLWANGQYAIGLSGNLAAMSIGLTVVGLALGLASYGILRRQTSNDLLP